MPVNPRPGTAALLRRIADVLDPPPEAAAARVAAIARHPSAQVLDETSIAYGRADLQLVSNSWHDTEPEGET
jgi:hypothetical protein